MYNSNQYNPYTNYGNYNQQIPNFAQNFQNNVQNQPQMQQFSQPLTQKPTISGKMIESIEMAKTIETPMDGSFIYLPLLDKSAIVVKRLTNNGTSELVVYKPVEQENNVSATITLEDIKQSIEDLRGGNNDEIMQMIGDLTDSIENLRKELKKKGEK